MPGPLRNGVAGWRHRRGPVAVAQALASPVTSQALGRPVFSPLTAVTGENATVPDYCALLLALPRLPQPALAGSLPPAVLARLLTRLTPSALGTVLVSLPPRSLAQVLSGLPPAVQSRILGELPTSVLSRPALAKGAERGAANPDATRCRAPRLPRRIPYACIAYRQTEPPTPELLDRVLKGLRRL